MTQDEIIEMARQAGAHDNGYEVRFVEPKYLERFAKLVAEKEREARRAYIYELERDLEVAQDKINEYLVADYQRARGQA